MFTLGKLNINYKMYNIVSKTGRYILSSIYNYRVLN